MIPALQSDRRTFLKRLAMLAAGAALAPVVRVVPAAAGSGRIRIQEERMLMGTFVGLTVLAPSRMQGEEAVLRAFAEMESQIRVFDRFDASTPLSILNREGRLCDAPGELLSVLDFSDGLFMRSGGLFDVTVAPVVNLLARTHGAPDKNELGEALALVGAGRMSRRDGDIRFGSRGMAVTLDGVAKGHIADRAAAALERMGIDTYLVDAGGDIRVQGAPEGRPWRIAIQDPDKGGNYPAVIELRSGAVATSGGYESGFDKAGTSHHLINPDTGASPAYVRSVSVQAPTVMQADGLATALSLMHPREALPLTDSLPGHSCLLVTSSGARLASDNWGMRL